MKFKLTITNKIYLALFSILFLLLFMGVINSYYLNKINLSTSNLIDIEKKSTTYNEVQYGIIRILEVNDYLFEGYWGMYEFYENEVNIISKNIVKLEQLLATDLERLQLKNLKETYTKHHEVVDDFNVNKFSLNFSEIEKETFAKINIVQPELLKRMQLVSDYYKKELDQAIIVTKHTKSRSQDIILVVSVLAILITIFILFSLIQTIIKPIIKLKEATVIVSKGNYSKKIEVNSKDELGELAESFNTMILNLNKTKEEINRTTKNLSTLINNLGSGIIMVSESRHVMIVNHSFCKMFRMPVTSDKLIGIDFSQSTVQVSGMFVNPEGFVAKSKEYINNKKVVIGEELELSDGSTYIRDYWPIHFEDGTIGHLWKYEDISNRKKQEKELIKAKVEAEEAGKVKEIFLANMSHEIRTPMNAIMGMTELLIKTTLDVQQNKFVNTINVASKNLLVVINDVLDISKLKRGKVKFEKTGFRIRPIFEHIIEINERNLGGKEIFITSKIEPELENLIIKGDPYRLTQILLNLVGNAIKFTEKGSVKMECELFKQKNKKITLRFIVRDTGIGIPKNQLSNIFDYFEQSDVSTTRKYGGSGLGLTISQHLVEAQKGVISVESIENVGSSFSFIIPYGEGTENDLESDENKIDESIIKELGTVRVLLVEDNLFNQMVGVEILEYFGLETDMAENGKVAIQKLHENEYDIILMDIQMPVMGGVEATKHIRSQFNDRKANIPIIALTANVISEDREKYLEAGMNDCVSKPFKGSVLYQKIGTLVTNFRKGQSEGSVASVKDKNLD